MLGAGVPGAAGQLGGAEAVPVALVEGVGHGAHPRRPAASAVGRRSAGSRRGRRASRRAAPTRRPIPIWPKRPRMFSRWPAECIQALKIAAHGAEAAAAPGDVLGRPPAADRHVADPLDPVGELAPAGFVAELVAAKDVGGLAGGRAVKRGRAAEAAQAACAAGEVGHAAHRPLLLGGGRAEVRLAGQAPGARSGCRGRRPGRRARQRPRARTALRKGQAGSSHPLLSPGGAVRCLSLNADLDT